MIRSSEYVKQAEGLLQLSKEQRIPYCSRGGDTLAAMDCQGLMEYLLRQCGCNVNYMGSNDMYRNALSWSGTVEECVTQFGHVPSGAWLFIHDYDGGEPDKYKLDGKGNAYHVGVYLGNNVALHASASRECVTESIFRERSINGGWNVVGLCRHISYDEMPDEGGMSTPEVEKPLISIPTFAPIWEPHYRKFSWGLGDYGDGTREVQTGLSKIGYDITVDGVFGRGTKWAVEHFQRANGLTIDGVVGRQTWGALIKEVNAV